MNREERERTKAGWRRPKQPAYAVGQWWQIDEYTYCICHIAAGRVFYMGENGDMHLFVYSSDRRPDHWIMVGKW